MRWGARTKQCLRIIRPLDEQSIMVGRARTAAYMEVYHVEPGINPYELEMDLVDSLKPDENDPCGRRSNVSSETRLRCAAPGQARSPAAHFWASYSTRLGTD
jgi:hypothetical protein